MTEELKKRIAQINAGTAPAGYKKTKVGIVPEEWETIRLGNICEINRGGSPRPIEQYLTTDSNGINWIKIGDAEVGGKYITSTKEKIKPTGEKKSRKVYSGDFLLSNSMSYGRPYILQIDGCIHDGWLVISKYQHRFILDYFYYTLCSTQVQKQYDILSAGSGVQNLNKELVSQVTVMIPPLPEQQKIAEILTAQDAVIALMQKQIELLQKQKKAFLQKMFPQKGCNVPEIRFVGFTDAWEQRKVEGYASFLTGNGLSWSDVSDDGKQECILYGNLYTDYGMITDIVVNKTNATVSNAVRSKYGDVLIPASDTTPTGLARATSLEKSDVLLGGDINIIRPNEGINGSCLSLALNANKKELIRLIKGTTVRHIHNSEIKDIELFMPKSKEEQTKIAEYFKELDTLITLHQRKLEIEQQKKKNLMQLLLTGKVRVKT